MAKHKTESDTTVDTTEQVVEVQTSSTVSIPCIFSTVRIRDTYYHSYNGYITIPAELEKEAKDILK